MDGKPLRVRITGDINNPRSIEIVEAESGSKLTNVVAIDIHIDRDESSISLTLYGGENAINLSGYANVTIT